MLFGDACHDQEEGGLSGTHILSSKASHSLKHQLVFSKDSGFCSGIWWPQNFLTKESCIYLFFFFFFFGKFYLKENQTNRETQDDLDVVMPNMEQMHPKEEEIKPRKWMIKERSPGLQQRHTKTTH